MDEQHISYYAIIPANVRYDEDLTPNAKLLYGEITALCNMKGYCWASNSYFADLYKVSKVSISKWIKQLLDKGYIQSEFKYKEGTKEIEYRYLTIVNGGIKEKLNTPIKEKFKDNNTVINNTNNIKDMVDSKESTEHSNLDIQFDEWWNIYDKKKQKPKALAAFKKVVKKYGYDELKANTEFFVKNHVKDKQYQPYPSTFLNNYHPDDEDFKNIGNQPNKNNYNNYNTNNQQQAMQYNEPDTDTLYSGGDWE